MAPSLSRNPNPCPTLSDIQLIRAFTMVAVAGVLALVLAWGVYVARLYIGCEKAIWC
jgi:hypothetical protein